METNIVDLELITKVKTDACSDSLVELSKRHSALCFEIYRKFTPSLVASGLCVNEIAKEKDFVLYRAALSFNPDKGTKFSTWLGNQVRYQCLNAINNNGQYVLVEDKELQHFIDKNYADENGFEDASIINKIFSLLKELDDDRIITIFKMRYIDVGAKKTTWKSIAKSLNLSTQTVINLHEKGRKHLEKNLKDGKTI